jgi:hypothetical protein
MLRSSGSGLEWFWDVLHANVGCVRAVQVRAFKDVRLEQLKLNKLDGKSI